MADPTSAKTGLQRSILRYLDLSTAHLREDTMAWLDDATPACSPCSSLSIAPYAYGAFVSVPGQSQDWSDLDCPDDLKAVLAFARTMRCDIVRFDSDGPALAELPHFDW